MTVDLLKDKLRCIDQISNDKWMSQLDKRKIDELRFHDADRDRNRTENLDEKTYKKYHGNKKYYSGTTLSRSYVGKWITNHSEGKVFLDYACGNGGNAIKAAKAGAKLSIGIDISKVSIDNARANAVNEGVGDNTYFVQADAENTMLPDNSIDTVICSGMLHHLDLSYAFPELRRILRKGGRVIAVEALNYNPLIKLFRKMTPSQRTEWEAAHILSLTDVKFAKRFFKVADVRYWHLTSILTPYTRSALPVWNSIDKVLTRIPLVKQMAWMFTFEMIKE